MFVPGFAPWGRAGRPAGGVLCQICQSPCGGALQRRRRAGCVVGHFMVPPFMLGSTSGCFIKGGLRPPHHILVTK